MLGPDFFNNSSALLPVLLTKVADRTRRQANATAVSSLMFHRCFIGLALFGEGCALIGASAEGTRGWMIWVLSVVLLATGYVFASELWAADERPPAASPGSAGT